MIPIIGPKPLTPEWHAIHRRVTSGTAIARIMRGEAFSVWAEMTGQVPGFEGNADTEDGNDLEPAVLRMYARRMKALVCNHVPFLIDPECPSMGATIDGLAVPCGVPGVVDFDEAAIALDDPARWGVEAKTTKSRAIAVELGEEGTDELPEKFVWQAMTEAGVTGVSWVDVPVLIFGSIRIFKVHRNETLIDVCRRTAEDMVRRVRDNDPPAIDFASPANQEAVRSIYSPRAGVEIDLSPEAAELWEKRAFHAGLESEAKKAKETADTALRAIFKDAGIGRLPDGGVIKLTTVNRAEYVSPATSYSRFFYSKPRAKKGA